MIYNGALMVLNSALVRYIGAWFKLEI